MADKVFSGIAASDGIAIAPAYILVTPDFNITEESVSDIDKEITKLDKALEESKKDLESIKAKAKGKLSDDELEVFDAHLMILNDPDFIGQVKQEITDKKVNADFAMKDVSDQFIQTFLAMDDNAYMQERASDIKDVSGRVLGHILGIQMPDPALISEKSVLIAHDLTPSDTAQLDLQTAMGFATEVGGRTSHSAIMARSLEIPAIVGIKDLASSVNAGDMIILDGIDGKILINPSEDEIKEYTAKQAEFIKQKKEWKQLRNEATITKDGKHFDLAANIGTPKDVVGAIDNGAEGIGLYRSEFLYMDSPSLPDEETQFEAYKIVVEKMKGKQVIIRTMDIGGDKELPYLPLEPEMNPFLGFRAIRISLKKPEIFKTQLRALLRASAYGKLGIMFPMIGTTEEFRAAKAIYNEVRDDLIKNKVKIDENVQVGMMMEVPAAAVLADKFAKISDFFSIGTNDLIQYTMAADRGNENVSYLYQPYNPSILRLINKIVSASHAEGKWTGMCGEAAGDPKMIPFLLAMGLDEYSMSATSILRARSLMKKMDSSKLGDLLDKALNVNETNAENGKMSQEYIDSLK